MKGCEDVHLQVGGAVLLSATKVSQETVSTLPLLNYLLCECALFRINSSSCLLPERGWSRSPRHFFYVC